MYKYKPRNKYRHTFKSITALDDHSGEVNAIVVDDKYLYSGTSGKVIHVWEKGTWKVVDTLRAHSDEVNAIVVDDKYIYSGSRDRSINVWKKDSHRHVVTLNNHSDEVNAIVVNDTHIFSGSRDGHICMWEKDSWRVINCWRTSFNVNLMSIDPMFLYYAESLSNRIGMLSLSYMQPTVLGYPSGRGSYINAMTSDIWFVYAGCEDNVIRVWQKGTWNLVSTLNGRNSVNALAVDRNFIYSGLKNSTIDVWHKRTWKRIGTLHSSVSDYFSSPLKMVVDDTYIYITSYNMNVIYVFWKSPLLWNGWLERQHVPEDTLFFIRNKRIKINESKNYYITQRFNQFVNDMVGRNKIYPTFGLEDIPEGLAKELGYNFKKFGDNYYIFTDESLRGFDNLTKDRMSVKPIVKIIPKKIQIPIDDFKDLMIKFGYKFMNYNYNDYFYNYDVLIKYLERFKKGFSAISFEILSKYMHISEEVVRRIINELISYKKLSYRIDRNFLILQ